MTTPEATAEHYDVAVIGAGVVGCAIARRFTLDGARVVVLEKAAEVLDGASKANSAILHTGFDAPVGTLEADCIRAGHAEYREIRDRLGLPLIECGALVVAWTAQEAARLPALIETAHANGVTDVAPLSAAQARALEPALGPGVAAAFRVPGESLIDPWSAPHGYLAQALLNGATLRCEAEVHGGVRNGESWRLETAAGPVSARLVVNAAGLFGDTIETRLLGAATFRIRPRKGQFVVFDKTAAALAGHILLPVPTATTKGIVVCRTAWGNLLVGPTAEEQEDRTTATLDGPTLARLRARAEEILPALAGHEITAVYAGLRPATEEKGFRVRAEPAAGYIAVGGIRSTGLSAALGLAAHVRALWDAPLRPIAEPVWPAMPNLAETAERDWQRPGNGGIVCHCERVTRREVEAALTGPLAARTFAGLKRRTRVTMGRCQGFGCGAEIAGITAGRLAVPMLPRDGDE